MKTVLNLFAMLVVAVATTPAYAEESPRQLTLADCEAMLAPVIAKHLPQAKITMDDGQLTCRYHTHPFKIHSIHKTGHISPTPHDQEGPDVDGLLLQITIHDEASRASAADLPQVFARPYWRTFVNIYPAGKGRYLWLDLSYGQRTDPEVLDKIKRLFGPVVPASADPTHNRITNACAPAEHAGTSEKLAKDAAPDQAATADKADPLAGLDAKIRKNLAGDKWNEASKTLVAALWQDYRAAHANPPERATRVAFGKKPDVRGYDDYLGAYGREPAPARPFLEVAKGEAGGFHVKLEEHTIPAVLIGNTVVFTTGDIVHSGLPSFSEKPYCTLEMFLIIRTEGKFYFGSPSSPPDKWMPLTKHNQP